MKTAPSTSSQQGAVLVFTLLVLVVGSVILGGIAQLAVTQTLAGQTEWQAAARRMQIENSRALARQYILSQMWRGFGGLSAATLNNSETEGAGGFSLTDIEPPFGYWLSLEQDGTDRINPFNLFERGGFQSAWAEGQLRSGTGDDDGNVAWGFQVRTRSPIVAGFAFVNHRDAVNTWQPSRRINLQQANAAADYAVGFAALPRMPVSSVTNVGLPPAALTMFDLGFLGVPKAEANFGDLLQSPAAGSVTTNQLSATTASVAIDLNVYDYDSTSDTPRFYEVPYRVDVVAGGSTNYALLVTDLILTNSAGSGAGFKTHAVQILIPQSNVALTNVTLSGNNAREVYLYRQGPASPLLSITTEGGNRNFRIGMTLDCTANLNVSGVLTIIGGFRTDRLLTQTTGDFNLIPETNPTWKYDAIADRMMWLEDQRVR